MNGWPDCALEEEMLTIRPHPASIMSGSTAWVQWKTPFRLTLMIRCQASKLRSVKRLNPSTPAALTRMVIGPRSSLTAASASSTCVRSVTSAFCPNSESDGLRSRAATRYPSARSRSAMARPMPEAPPVTTAVFTSRCGLTGAVSPMKISLPILRIILSAEPGWKIDLRLKRM